MDLVKCDKCGHLFDQDSVEYCKQCNRTLCHDCYASIHPMCVDCWEEFKGIEDLNVETKDAAGHLQHVDSDGMGIFEGMDEDYQFNDHDEDYDDYDYDDDFYEDSYYDDYEDDNPDGTLL